MATAKPPGNERYRGAVGNSRRVIGHVACPCGVHHPVEAVAAIDVDADPTLARKLIADEPLAALTCPTTGESLAIARPVVVHDPERALFVLVLPEAFRVREIDERVALLRALADDPAPIPGYVLDFAVVYGGAGLARHMAATQRSRPTLVRGEEDEPTTAELIPLADRTDTRVVRRRVTPTRDVGEAILALAPPVLYRTLAGLRALAATGTDELLLAGLGVEAETLRGHRRAVLAATVERGFWPGVELADVAVAAGLAPSRKDLVVLLRRQFTALVAGGGHELEDAVLADNWQALRNESAAHDLTADELAPPRSEPIASGSDPVASGTIGQTRQTRRPTTVSPRVEVDGLDHDALVGLLGDATNRLPAGVELARRGEARAIGPVVAAIETMSRAEAGRMLGAVIGFGAGAAAPLVPLLAASKGYLRQGAALALAVLREDGGVEAVCDLLLSEPTEIWREVARALGAAGAPAVMPMAARLQGASEDGRERLAWALAHVAGRGAATPIESLANGRDPVAAAVGRRALEQRAEAERDQHAVMSDEGEQTVNRAFSRRFFEAMPSGVAPAAPAPPAGEHVAELDEADLLPH